jgi:hypothetical protein
MTTSYDSKRQINDLDELVAIDDAFAPDRVEIGERLFCDGFLGGLSRGLQQIATLLRFKVGPLSKNISVGNFISHQMTRRATSDQVEILCPHWTPTVAVAGKILY